MSRRTNDFLGCAFVAFLLLFGLIFLIKSCVNGDISLPSRREYTYEDAQRDQHKKRMEEINRQEENYRRRGICPTCHGEGSIYVTYRYRNGNRYIEYTCPKDQMHVNPSELKNTKLETCFSCKGTGKYEPNAQRSSSSANGSSNNVRANVSNTQSSAVTNTTQKKKCEYCHGTGHYMGVMADPKYPHAQGDMYFYCGLCREHFLYITKDIYGNFVYLEENSKKHNHNCPYCHGTGRCN